MSDHVPHIVFHANPESDNPSVIVTGHGFIELEPQDQEWSLVLSVEESEDLAGHLMEANRFIRSGRKPATTPHDETVTAQEPATPTQAGSWGTGPDVDPLTDEDAFSTAVSVAIGEFFHSIAGSYPECPTGDFPPDADETFYKAARRATEEWIRANHPTHQEHPFTVVYPHRGRMTYIHATGTNPDDAITRLGEFIEAGRDGLLVFPGHVVPESAR